MLGNSSYVVKKATIFHRYAKHIACVDIMCGHENLRSVPSKIVIKRELPIRCIKNCDEQMHVRGYLNNTRKGKYPL